MVPVPTWTYSLEEERSIVYLITDTWEGKDGLPWQSLWRRDPLTLLVGRDKLSGSKIKDPAWGRREGADMCTQAGPGPALRGSVLRRGPATHNSTAAPQDGLGPAHRPIPWPVGITTSTQARCGDGYGTKCQGIKAVSQSAFTPQKCKSAWRTLYPWASTKTDINCMARE